MSEIKEAIKNCYLFALKKGYNRDKILEDMVRDKPNLLDISSDEKFYLVKSVIRKFYNLIDDNYLIDKRRNEEVRIPRQIFMVLIIFLQKNSSRKITLCKIADYCGGKKHGTVLHAKKAIEKLKSETDFKNDFDYLENFIYTSYESVVMKKNKFKNLSVEKYIDELCDKIQTYSRQTDINSKKTLVHKQFPKKFVDTTKLKKESKYEANCLYCGNRFHKANDDDKFCSYYCDKKYRDNIKFLENDNSSK